MIVTDLNHIEQQISTSAFKKAIAFLRQPDVHLLADGRVDIDGQNVYAIIQRYETLATDAPKFEYHQKYIDIQYIATGEEVIGWVPSDRMTVTEPYVEDRDICFGSVSQNDITPVLLRAGQLMVLYPEDGHAPKLAAAAPSPVVKIVVKVAAG